MRTYIIEYLGGEESEGVLLLGVGILGRGGGLHVGGIPMRWGGGGGIGRSVDV